MPTSEVSPPPQRPSPTHALRLTFGYRNADLRLTESQRVEMITPAVVTPVPQQGQSGYWIQVTDAAGSDVLRVKTRIVDLIVNAPDVMSAGLIRTYTMSTGSMTLVAELYDSRSNEVLARVADQRESGFNETWRLTNSVINDAEVRDAASRWARILRDALDKAHGIGTK